LLSTGSRRHHDPMAPAADAARGRNAQDHQRNPHERRWRPHQDDRIQAGRRRPLRHDHHGRAPTVKRGHIALLVWAAFVAAAIFVITHTRFVADLSAFMPKAPTERQQMLLDQLRDGTIGRLVLLGIEGGDELERARLSRALADRLSQSATFSAVQNGDAQRMEQDQRYLFDNRYVLSPTVSADRFSSAGLHDAIQSTLEEMAGGAGLLMKSLLTRDPSGETLVLLEQFISESQPHVINGVWASRDGKRAVLMVEIRASGLNTDAMAQ